MNKIVLFMLSASLTLSLHASNSNLDPGGVSVDFSKVKPPSRITYGPNLIKNGSFENVDEKGSPVKRGEWYRSWHVHSPAGKSAESKALKDAAKDIVTTTTATDSPANGKRYAKYITPEKVHNMRFDKQHGKPMISNGFGITAALPAGDTTGQYQLSFKAKGKINKSVPGLNQLVVVVNYLGGASKIWKCKSTGKSLVKHFSVTPKWQQLTLPITVPNGTNFISFYIKLYGCGEVGIDDVALHQVKVEESVSAKMIPGGYIDNTFCLTPGDIGILCISCKNNANVNVKNPHMNLKLPEAVKMLGVGSPYSIESKTPLTENDQKYVIYKVDLKDYKPRRNAYFTWDMPSFQLETKAKPGQDFNAYYQFADDNVKSNWNHFKINVIKGAEATNAPKQFKTATMYAREGRLTNPEAINSFVKFHKKSGLNSIHGGTTPEMRKALKAAGIRHYTQPYFLCNGYRLGSKKKPESALFKLADGSYRTRPHEAICPVEVYQEGPYFKDAVVSYIRDILVTKDNCDTFMPNWELHGYDFKGCFCDRCKNEFIKHSKLDKAEVAKNWPQNIIIKYRQPWIKFRSWQHAKLVETLEKTTNRIGKEAGKDSHFIPEIAWSSLTEGGAAHYNQYDPKDYLDKLPIIEPWGPYIFFDVTKPYIYNSGVHLITYEAGKAIKNYVKNHTLDKSKIPQLLAFPHGFQCNTWVTEPEAIGFEMLCYLLNGWNGTFLYYFPRGYDARWMNAVANANRDIATYEKYIFNGQPANNYNVTPLTPFPDSNLPTFWAEGGNFLQKLPSLKTASLLQSRCYKLNDKILLAIGNFWQKGEAFVNAKVTGLAPDKKYIITQPSQKRNFTNSDKQPYFTGSELASGVTLHVGALRWAIYVVEPWTGNSNEGVTITQAELKEEMAKRLPTIKAALKWEKNYLKEQKAAASKANGIPDYSGMKSMHNEGVSCKVVKFEGNTAFEFTVKKQTITIAPAIGAQVKAWNNGKDNYIGTGQGAMIGADGFWWPKNAVGCLFTPYKFISQAKTDKGIQVVFQRTLTLKDSKSLQGNLLTKTYNIDGSGIITIKTTLANKTGQPINFSYRRKSMIRFMEVVNEKRGQATLGDLVYERDFTQKLMRYAVSPVKDLEKIFSMERLLVTKSPDVIFSAPFLEKTLDFKTLDKNKLHCFVFWDSGKQKYATFEPIFSKVSLGLQESWSISTQWQVK
jgi:hypothetical protein